MDTENTEVNESQLPQTWFDGTEEVVELLTSLQKEIIKKEGEPDKPLNAYIENKNCRLDNLYRIALSHGLKLVARNPISRTWCSYGNKPLELVKAVSFMFVEKYENYNNALLDLGLTKKTLENWLISHNFPLLKPFLKIAKHLGFEFSWIPQTKFCKTCKYRLHFPHLPNLQICWNMRSKKDNIKETDPACEYYKSLKIGE